MDDTPDASDEPQPATSEAGTGTNRRILAIVAAGVAVIIVVAGIAIAATRDSDDGGGTASPGVEQDTGTSTTLTPKQLAEKAAEEKRVAAAERRLDEKRRQAEEERRNTSSTTVPGSTAKPGSTTPTTGPRVVSPVTPPTIPPTIQQAYIAGYNQKCADIWKIANADGTLWDTAASEEPGELGAPFVLDDCTSQIDETEAWYYETPEEARTAAAEDAGWNLGFFMVGTILRNTDGTATWKY